MKKIFSIILISFIILLAQWAIDGSKAIITETTEALEPIEFNHTSQSEAELQDETWITTWGHAQKGKGLYPINDNSKTVEYKLPINNSSMALSLTLANYYGDEPLTIDRISVSIDQTIFTPLTVDGRTEFSLPPRLSVKTDRLDLDMEKGSYIYVRIAYPNQAEKNRPLSGNILSLDARRSTIGDYTLSNKFEVDRNYSDNLTDDQIALDNPMTVGRDNVRYIFTLQSANVLIENTGGTIVAFGDSITEQNKWVGPLSQKVTKELGETYNVINSGISGNRLLKDINNLPRRAQYLGVAATERFEHDVFEVNETVRSVIVAIGVNDIQQPGTSPKIPIEELPSFDEMIQGYEKIIGITKKHNSKIYLATITPFIGYATDVNNTEKERLRQATNKWIRENKDIDGVIDFDQVLANPKNKEIMSDNYNSQDKLHPNDQGGIDMANIINVNLLN